MLFYIKRVNNKYFELLKSAFLCINYNIKTCDILEKYLDCLFVYFFMYSYSKKNADKIHYVAFLTDVERFSYYFYTLIQIFCKKHIGTNKVMRILFLFFSKFLNNNFILFSFLRYYSMSYKVLT